MDKPNWIEIPACRVLEVDSITFHEHFRRVNVNGKEPEIGEETYRVIRFSDNKVFKPARFMPANATNEYRWYLEEL